jgi:hypothetical protein
VVADPGYEVKELRHPGSTLLLARPRAHLITPQNEKEFLHPDSLDHLDGGHAGIETKQGLRKHCLHKYAGVSRIYWCCSDGCYDIVIAKAGYRPHVTAHPANGNNLFALKPKALTFGPVRT